MLMSHKDWSGKKGVWEMLVAGIRGQKGESKRLLWSVVSSTIVLWAAGKDLPPAACKKARGEDGWRHNGGMRTWTRVATVGRKIPGAAEVNQERTSDAGDKDGGVKDVSKFPR